MIFLFSYFLYVASKLNDYAEDCQFVHTSARRKLAFVNFQILLPHELKIGIHYSIVFAIRFSIISTSVRLTPCTLFVIDLET